MLAKSLDSRTHSQKNTSTFYEKGTAGELNHTLAMVVPAAGRQITARGLMRGAAAAAVNG